MTALPLTRFQHGPHPSTTRGGHIGGTGTSETMPPRDWRPPSKPRRKAVTVTRETSSRNTTAPQETVPADRGTPTDTLVPIEKRVSGADQGPDQIGADPVKSKM